MSSEADQKNTIALRDEAIRQRDLIAVHEGRLSQLECEIVSLRQELLGLRLMAAAAIGRGSSA